MDETTKRAIKKTILALRKLLEKEDIPAVLKQYGIFPDGRRISVEKLAILDDNGRNRREGLEAIINREVQAVGGDQKLGILRYCREVAFTYLNRLVALRSMEARGLIDECIRIRDDYAGRSLRHHRFLGEHSGVQFDEEDADSLKAFLRAVFRELQDDVRILFDPDDEYSILMPSLQAIRECIRALNEDISEDAFKAPELIGWVYQYFQTEEKGRVFEEVRTKKKKIEGDDIIPATSLYTERYMVDFLVQNSLGAIWMEMYPDSRLCENWPYFVRDQDLKPRKPRPVKSLTFLDPASGSGHFLLISFDLLTQMYEEEARLASEGKIPKEWIVTKEKIATTILESNLHGIDIDLRSVQLSYLVLYLRMREYQKSVGVPKTLPTKINLVAADASLLNTPEFLSWCEERFKEEPYTLNIIKGIVGRLHNLSEIGSLARPEEDLKELVHQEKERLFSAWKQDKAPVQLGLFEAIRSSVQTELPFEKITDDQFWEGVLSRVTKVLDEYYRQAAERGDTNAQVLAHEASRGFKFLELYNKRYDVVAANPPYMTIYIMGNALRETLYSLYPNTYYDLFSAFLKRATELLGESGVMAYVAQSSFLYIRNFTQLRETLLRNAVPTVVANLGTGAFLDISGEKVNVLLYIGEGNNTAKTSCFLDVRKTTSKSTALKMQKKEVPAYYVTPQTFKEIPNFPFIYNIPSGLRTLLRAELSLRKNAQAFLGLKTANNDRYCRFFWELPNPKINIRWRPLVTATNGWPYYCDTFGRISFQDSDIEYYRKHVSAQIYNKSLWFKAGLTFGAAAGRGFDVKILPSDAIVLNSSNLLIPKDPSDIMFLNGVLNSSLYRVLMNLLNPTINNTPGDVHRLPWPRMTTASRIRIQSAADEIVSIMKLERSFEPTSEDFVWSFKVSNLKILVENIWRKRLENQALYVSRKALIENEVLNGFSIDDDDKAFVLEWNGVAPCHVVENGVAEGQDITVRTIDADCTLELICIKYSMTPQEVLTFQLNSDIKDKEYCSIVETWMTVLCLRLLGFCWPQQIGAGESVPDWADRDGIIPITGHTEEKALLERIRDRIGAEFGEDRIADIEAEFADILYNAACKEAEIKGRTPPKKKIALAPWLENEFFKRHTSQFKKRPIGWHLTSSNGTFQVLLFYHKISLDMLKNLKNRYLAKVQSYYGTILDRARRGESVSGGLTEGKLSDIESELEEFANKLDKIINMPYEPLIDDGVRVNISPLQKIGLLASPVLATKDIDRAIADRNRWREDDKEQDTVWRI